MFESSGIWIASAAAIACLVASGVGLAFFVGRQQGLSVSEDLLDSEPQLPDLFVKELEKCLELGDYVARDADTLAAAFANQATAADRQTAGAVQQLLKTSKMLTGRINRMGVQARLTRPQRDSRPIVLSDPTTDTTYPSAISARELTAEELELVAAAEATVPPSGPFEDARKFPRSSFRGSAAATIYPRHPGPGREPVQCTVLTRDLSCGGIGIAHSEQLVPKQIIVIDAVGKLLVGEVRWCRRTGEYFYIAGCRLVKTNG